MSEKLAQKHIFQKWLRGIPLTSFSHPNVSWLVSARRLDWDRSGMNCPPEEFVSLDYRGRWVASMSQLTLDSWRWTIWITTWLRNLNFLRFQWEGALKIRSYFMTSLEDHCRWLTLYPGWTDPQQSSQIASKALSHPREQRGSQGWIWLTKALEGTALLRPDVPFQLKLLGSSWKPSSCKTAWIPRLPWVQFGWLQTTNKTLCWAHCAIRLNPVGSDMYIKRDDKRW